jgi:hypothetical protein
MTRETRAVALAALTFFMFALTVFLTDGSFVFPFPLNEFALLIVSFLLVWWHPKKGLLPYLLLTSALCAALGTRFFWETVMSYEELVRFMDLTVIDWARFSAGIFLIAAMFYFFSSYKQWYFKAAVALAIGLYIWGFATTGWGLYGLAFVLLTAISTLKPVQRPFHVIWTLYFLLYGMKWTMIHLL